MEARTLRRAGTGLVPLAESSNGLLCAEGDVVVVASRTAALPLLHLRGEALSPVPGTLAAEGGGFVAQFELLVDSWAGRTTLVLDDDGSELAVMLDVRPSGSKLGPGEWEGLIGELAALSQALPWGLSPGSATGAFEPDALATVHPAIMELELPPLLRLLKALLADPPTRTLRTRAQRPLDLSRSADLRTLRWLSTRPLELAGLRGAAPEGSHPDPRVLVDQPSAMASPDHPVTRYVASLLARVRARLAETAARLRRPAGHGVPDPAARAYARHLAGRAEAAMAAIGSVQRAPLFRAVRPGELSEDVLQSLQDHPVHAAIHRSCRRLLRPGLLKDALAGHLDDKASLRVWLARVGERPAVQRGMAVPKA